MTAQLTHETRLMSIALSTTTFPIIWCAGHLPAQNNDGHMFYQKLKDTHWRCDSVPVPMCIFETVDSFNGFVH